MRDTMKQARGSGLAYAWIRLPGYRSWNDSGSCLNRLKDVTSSASAMRKAVPIEMLQFPASMRPRRKPALSVCRFVLYRS